MLCNSDITSIAADDVSAFKRLYDELSSRLFFYLYKWQPEVSVCEDIVQESFLLYWNNRHNFTALMPVKVYIFSVAKNLLRNHSRVEINRKRIIENMPPPDSDQSEDHLLICAELAGIISAAIDQLPPQTARIIRLSLDDYTVPMIAQTLAISQNTVKTLKKSGYKLLRQRLAHLQPLLAFIFSI